MRKRAGICKKTMAVMLAAVMSVSGTAVSAPAEATTDSYKLAVHYDMSNDGAYLLDQSGNGNDGKIHNIPSSAFKEELGDQILTLPGGNAGADGPYVELPLSIADDLDDYSKGFSVEIALIPRTAQYQFLWTIGTGDMNDYLFFNPRLGSGKMNVAVKTDGNEQSIPGAGGISLDTKRFNVVTVTSEGQTLKLYVDGEYKDSLTHTRDLSRLFAGNGEDILGYLAKSNWGADPYCDAVVSDFKIYNQVLTDSQVKAIYDRTEYVYASQLIEDDMAAMDLGNISAVTEDLKLPLAGEVNGSVITWVSKNPDVISNDGRVTMPDQTTGVELTATFTLEGASLEKTYTVYVVGKNDRRDVILEQYLNLPYYMTARDILPMQVMGVDINWESDSADVDTSTGAVTPSQPGISDVKLKASVTVDGIMSEKEFRVKLLGTDSAYILSYIREADNNRDGMYDEDVSCSMHLGYSEDGTSYEALLNNTGVLFAKAQGELTKLLKDPYVFRMKDGSFGVLAVRINKGETAADTEGSLLFFTSEDLVSYTEAGMIQLSEGGHIEKPACTYDAVRDCYRITWTSKENGLSYANITKDFKHFDAKQASAPLQRNVSNTDIPYAIEGNVAGITAEEEAYLLNKLGTVVNTTVDVPEITTTAGAAVDVAKVKVTANYSDGSSAEKSVIWEKEDIEKIDFDTAGTYTVNGVVKQISDQTAENDPFIPLRADPTITEYNGKYYFIATTEAAVDNNYGLYIREADTITGLNQAKQHRVYDEKKAAEYGYVSKTNHWAPELHVVNGQLYMFFSTNLGDGFNVQSMLMKLTGPDPTDYNDWGELKQFLNKDGQPLSEPYGGITLDMTYFTYLDRHYVAWSQRNFGKNGGTADIWMGEIDADKPYQLISDAVKIVDCEYGWERNHTFVTEGPNTIIRDGKLYLTYSGGATDETYCVGMTSIALDENTNFLDKNAWQKSNYPILTGLSTEGYCGPGHNAYVEDKDGTLINVYHAKKGVYGSRDTFLRIVHFGADGAPILDMTEEREILPENKRVVLTVQVKEEPDPVNLPFVDVESGTWYYDEVANVFEKGLMTGTSETVFAPGDSLSRAQFAVTLYRMENKPEVNYDHHFPDVDDNTWYTDGIAWVSGTGVIIGYADKKFGPADKITREQMAVSLYRYAVMKNYNTDDRADFDKYEDASQISSFAEEAMQWAVGSGMIKGKFGETILDPQGDVTRAECAVVLTRFLEKFGEE